MQQYQMNTKTNQMGLVRIRSLSPCSFHRIEDVQVGWVASGKLTDAFRQLLQRKGWLGKKKEDRLSIVSKVN